VRDLKWSPREKKVAHAAFDVALSRERATIRARLEAMLADSPQSTQVWRIRDYLNDRAPEIDRKYDFRYSVLIGVFARLIGEGWLTIEELAGLDDEKLGFICECARFWQRST
jgi:hypothetical protein